MMKDLQRRDFLKGASVMAGAAAAAVAMPGRLAFAQGNGIGYENDSRKTDAGRVKITGVRNIQLRLEKDYGTYPGWTEGSVRTGNQTGGTAICEVTTDAGITGIASGLDPLLIPLIEAVVKGKDPFDINLLAIRMFGMPAATTAGYRSWPVVEMAIWDVIGKIMKQPLYKIWGGGRDRVIPYASLLRLSTVQERVDNCVALKAAGWRGAKLRNSFPTMKDDVRVVELIRKANGPDWIIMCDGNKASLNPGSTSGYKWDYPRAHNTLAEYAKLGVYWIEEPMYRFDHKGLARLREEVPNILYAGGEGDNGLSTFVDLINEGCFDVLQPEIMSQGVRVVRNSGIYAECVNMMMCPHQGDRQIGTVIDMHIEASLSNAPFLEIFNDRPVGNYEYPMAIFENPLVLTKDGYFNLPQGPGHGMKVRQDLIIKG